MSPPLVRVARLCQRNPLEECHTLRLCKFASLKSVLLMPRLCLALPSFLVVHRPVQLCRRWHLKLTWLRGFRTLQRRICSHWVLFMDEWSKVVFRVTTPFLALSLTPLRLRLYSPLTALCSTRILRTHSLLSRHELAMLAPSTTQLDTRNPRCACCSNFGVPKKRMRLCAASWETSTRSFLRTLKK